MKVYNFPDKNLITEQLQSYSFVSDGIINTAIIRKMSEVFANKNVYEDGVNVKTSFLLSELFTQFHMPSEDFAVIHKNVITALFHCKVN